MKARSYAVVSFAVLIFLCTFCYSKTVYSPAKAPKEPAALADESYVVRRGDNLIKIAKKFNTTAKVLSAANGLRSDRIRIGQVLAIPSPKSPEKAASIAAIPYTVSAPAAGPVTGSDPEDKMMRHQLVEAGFKFLGVRYRFSGTSPKSGFDCSGLVKTLFSKFDIELPRTSKEQYRQGKTVKRDDLEIGDLVFFSSGGTQPTHVGIYVGDNKFLHAARKARRVIVSDLNKLWYAMRYLGARRITDLWGDEQTSQTAGNQESEAGIR